MSSYNDNLELSPLHKFILKLKDFSKDLTQVFKAQVANKVKERIVQFNTSSCWRICQVGN